MAIIWADGFEHYGDDETWPQTLWAIQRLGAPPTLSTEQARTGNYSYKFTTTSRIRRSLKGDYGRAGVAFGLYLLGLPGDTGHAFSIATFLNADGGPHISVKIGSTGRVLVYRAGTGGLATYTLLAQSAKELAPGVWNHIEVACTVSEGSGSVDVLVNGKEFVSYEGDTVGDSTTSQAEPSVGQLGFGIFDNGVSRLFVECYYDDIIAWAGDGTEPVGLYGVYYQRPISDAIVEWDLTEGTDAFALLDELGPDGDTQYAFTGTVGDRLAMAVEPLPLNITDVAAVMPIALARKTDTGECDVTLGVISINDAVVNAPEGDPLLTNYGYFYYVVEEDPDTEGPWNPLGLPAICIERTG